jgi:hypothetical protein
VFTGRRQRHRHAAPRLRRAAYLTANGNPASSIRLPQRTVVSAEDYRESAWHLVTTTMSAVTGFWRRGGGGDHSAYPSQPGAPYFSGALDERRCTTGS